MGKSLRCFVGLVLLSVQTSATGYAANPLQKVMELLDVLGKQIVKEGKEDEEAYGDYKTYYTKEAKKSKDIITNAEEQIAELQSDLKEAEAFRQGKATELVNTANSIAKNEAELTAGREGRKKDREVFEKNEAAFVESIDQLDRALAVMQKKMPTAAASASLLSVAQRLKSTLTQDSDFSLSTSQREILESFMRAAQTLPAPSFLQYSSSGPFEEDKRGGGVLATLAELKTKVAKEKADAMEEEEKSRKEFKTFESGLVTSIESKKKSLSDIKNAIAQSQEKSSQQEAQVLEAQEIAKVTKEHFEQIEQVFRVKTHEYRLRLGKRQDEAIAIHEATRILNNDYGKSFIKEQSIGDVSGGVYTAKGKKVTFLQFSQEKHSVRRKVLHVLRKATTPGLALLAIRSVVHHKQGTDPFSKVKTMLKGMLEKLQEKQAQESKHAAWCDKEMAETAKNRKRKDEDVQKIKDRLEALEASLEQTKTEKEETKADLDDITSALTEATTNHKKETEVLRKAVKTFTDGEKLCRKAVDVLKSYYENEAGGGREVNKKEFKDRHGVGTGVIALLEIAIDDFSKLQAESQENLEVAERDFRDMNSESLIRKAVFEKELEYKEKTRVKLEFDQTTMNNDMKSYEKELGAINSYMDQLKASCIVKGPTYAERKAKRETELASLRDALDALTEQR